MNRLDRQCAIDARTATLTTLTTLGREAASAGPLPVTAGDVERAAAALDGIVTRTPVLSSVEADLQTGAQVFFKCENFQRTGAFKFRGAYHAILRLDAARRRAGVIAYSSGNHAQGIALAARMLDTPATVVMPADAPAPKVRAARDWGARVVFYDRLHENRETICDTLARESGATVIASSDHPDVIAGQGTVARELFAETGPLDYLFAPVGGGGLISGCAITANHWAPNCRVIGVEPERGNDAQLSLSAGQIVRIAPPDTIADGARNQWIGALALPIMQAHVRQIETVSDDALRAQMRFFAERMKLVVEPTGCLAAAAVMGGALDLRGARVGVVISGGNADFSLLADALTQPCAPAVEARARTAHTADTADTAS